MIKDLWDKWISATFAKRSPLKIILFLLFMASFCLVFSYPSRKEDDPFKNLFGLHGRVTSITRFYPFEVYDVSSNISLDLSLEYLEITTVSGKTRRMIYLGSSEYILEDEVCLLFSPTRYGSFLLRDIFDKDDPARDIPPLSNIRVAADGIVASIPFSHCSLCSDEEEKIYLVYLSKGRGKCRRWNDEDGVSHIRLEKDEKNFGEANSAEGCLRTGGSGGCVIIPYREY